MPRFSPDPHRALAAKQALCFRSRIAVRYRRIAPEGGNICIPRTNRGKVFRILRSVDQCVEIGPVDGHGLGGFRQ
jgi:hypothetical protein